MGQYSSYYLYQKYEKRGSGNWIPSYPNTFSVDGDGTMTVVEKSSADTACGYIPKGTDDYNYSKWVVVDGYICDDTTKYVRERKYVSDDNINWTETDIYRRTETVLEYNSTDCGYDQQWDSYNCYKWEIVSGDYTCNEGNKYQKLRKYFRICNNCDNCSSQWSASNIYKQGEILEYNSTDCGYIIGRIQYRWVNNGFVCVGYDKHYRQQRQISYTQGQIWLNLDEYRTDGLYQKDSSDCGSITIYRWVNLDPSTDYYCSGTTKYYKQQEQKSYDNGETWIDETPPTYRWGTSAQSQSTDCGYIEPQYRTTSGTPYCSGTSGFDKYVEVYSQVSYDGGSTWETTATTPTLVEENSEYCGYSPSPSGYSGQYLTFVALENGTFNFSPIGTRFSGNSLSYSLDSGSTWNTLPVCADTPTISIGNKIMWKGENLGISDMGGIGKFSSTSQFNVEGNIMSLLYGDNFSNQTSLSDYPSAFYDLFINCQGLINVENLILPATTLTERCYQQMFLMCSSLTTSIKELPATTLTDSCYASMFGNCRSLTTTPSIIPAVTIGRSSCIAMFQWCENITTAPELPTLVLAYHCYDDMFYGCRKLNYVKCLATDMSADGCTYQWLYGVASSGTFIKNTSATWARGNNGIPSNWTVQNAT